MTCLVKKILLIGALVTSFQAWYISNLLTTVCPLKNDVVFAPSLFHFSKASSYPSLNAATCYLLHEYVVPHYDEHVSPILARIDDRLDLSKKRHIVGNALGNVRTKILEIDDKYSISLVTRSFARDSIALTKLKINRIVSELVKIYTNSIHPALHKAYIKAFLISSKYYYIILDHLRVQLNVAFSKTKNHVQIFHNKYVLTHYLGLKHAIYTQPVFVKLREYYYLSGAHFVIDYIVKSFDAVYSKGSAFQQKLHTKNLFLKEELYSLIGGLNAGSAKATMDQVYNAIKEHFDGSEEKLKSTIESVGENIEEVIEDFKSDATEVESKDLIDPEIEKQQLEEENFPDDEPLTIQITQTVTVLQKAKNTDSATKNDTEADVETLKNEQDLSKSAIDRVEDEIEYWRHQINKTCLAAIKNLHIDLDKFVDEYIESEVKPIIGDKLTNIQTQNYKNYKEINSHIEAVSKDASYMLEHDLVILGPEDEFEDNFYVSRQDIRDDIADSSKYVEDEVDVIREILTGLNTKVVEKYMHLSQEVIDVLDSFAGLTMQEFTMRLHMLLSVVEQEEGLVEEETISWNAWKQFHQIKEQIFQTRDLVLDEANSYQSRFISDDVSISNVPEGFKKWEEYLKQIVFHTNFLILDNVDFLQIVRARANIAFQEREMFIRKFDERKKLEEEYENKEEVFEENNEANEEERLENAVNQNEEKKEEKVEVDEGTVDEILHELVEDPEAIREQTKEFLQDQENIKIIYSSDGDIEEVIVEEIEFEEGDIEEDFAEENDQEVFDEDVDIEEKNEENEVEEN